MKQVVRDHTGDWLMDDGDIANALGVKKASWMNRVCQGTHPPFIKVEGIGRRYWHSDFTAWLDGYLQPAGTGERRTQ